MQMSTQMVGRRDEISTKSGRSATNWSWAEDKETSRCSHSPGLPLIHPSTHPLVPLLPASGQRPFFFFFFWHITYFWKQSVPLHAEAAQCLLTTWSTLPTFRLLHCVFSQLSVLLLFPGASTITGHMKEAETALHPTRHPLWLLHPKSLLERNLSRSMVGNHKERAPRDFFPRLTFHVKFADISRTICFAYEFYLDNKHHADRSTVPSFYAIVGFPEESGKSYTSNAYPMEDAEAAIKDHCAKVVNEKHAAKRLSTTAAERAQLEAIINIALLLYGDSSRTTYDKAFMPFYRSAGGGKAASAQIQHKCEMDWKHGSH